MQKKNYEQIKQEFHQRQTRQIIAIAIALFVVMLCAVMYKRPGVLGEYSKASLFAVQIVTIASFMVYTSYNWRCPVCGKSLGTDINKRSCKKCKTRLR
jgi:uncharacterized membrane protein YkvI